MRLYLPEFIGLPFIYLFISTVSLNNVEATKYSMCVLSCVNPNHI